MQVKRLFSAFGVLLLLAMCAGVSARTVDREVPYLDTRYGEVVEVDELESILTGRGVLWTGYEDVDNAYVLELPGVWKVTNGVGVSDGSDFLLTTVPKLNDGVYKLDFVPVIGRLDGSARVILDDDGDWAGYTPVTGEVRITKGGADVCGLMVESY